MTVIAITIVACQEAVNDPVRTAQGLVSGVAGRSPDVRVFKGIPFAAPPVGPLRWKPPQPAERWSGVRRGDAFGPRCMQIAGDAGGSRRQSTVAAEQPMNEDCLYLNVWTAAESAGDRRPVMVWAHGGSFQIGAGSWPEFDGEALARKGAVVVTVNYRLGPFGFFAHPDLTRESGRNSSGNYALMDFVAALEWVQQNIAGFGGDPDRVTIVGESAGGYLALYAMTSPQFPKLFHRVVIQSAPTRILPMMTLSEAETAGREAAKKIGAGSIEALQALSSAEVLASLPPLRPTLDGWPLTEDTWTSARAGRLKSVDLLIGANKDEGTFPYLRAGDVGLGPMSREEFTTYVRTRFGPDADAFFQLYPVHDESAVTGAQQAAFTDEAAWIAQFLADSTVRAGATSYLYSFVHEPPVPAGEPNRRATHTAEFPYMFNNPTQLWTAVDRRVADTMSSYWVNFARTGDPNGQGLPAWPAFVPGDGAQLMQLGPTVAPAPTLDPARARLFETLSVRLIG
jgi:carboxylesterase type B